MRRWVLLIFFIFLGPEYSWAQDKVLSTFTGNSKNPRIGDPTHPKGGMTPELVAAIAERMGYQQKTHFLPWKRAIESAQGKDSFGLFPASKNLPVLEKFLLVDMPLYELQLHAIVPAKSTLQEVRRADAKKLTTCELLGAVTFKKMGLNVNEVKEAEQCIKLFNAGRLDFMMLTDEGLRRYLEKGSYRIVPDDLGYKPAGYFLVNKAYPQARELHEKFYKAFQELEGDGTLEKIRRSYPAP